MKFLGRYFPILVWGSEYNKDTLASDLVAAVIVTIMLIPQSLAYALIAGLPAEVGLYASILPLVAYSLFGSSKVLAVGPVAVASLMTASALGNLGPMSEAQYVAAAILLALLSGVFLIGMGILRLGAIANYLSHPVISGFISASGILIAIGQVKHILGLDFSATGAIDIAINLVQNIGQINGVTFTIGLATLGFLYFIKLKLSGLLSKTGLSPALTSFLVKSGPMFGVIFSISAVWAFDLADRNVAIVGSIPQGLPPFGLPDLSPDLVKTLMLPAILIGLVGFVESVSVGQTLAAKRRQKIDPNQELVGLGAANVASAMSGGYPVTGGFARSVVNYDAGAQTPAAGAYSAVGILLATLFLTPFLFFLPKATLAATIIVAVLGLVDFKSVLRIFNYSKSDFTAMILTIALTLFYDVEMGILAGVVSSLGLHLYRSSKPHYAIVGQVDDTEHFRNIKRHEVKTEEEILSMRIDESLFFANARYLEDQVMEMVADHPKIEHFILLCNAVNHIDSSALESLESIADHLKDMNIKMHFSEVKGPVMDRLQKTDFFEHVTGNVYLTHYQAIRDLT